MEWSYSSTICLKDLDSFSKAQNSNHVYFHQLISRKITSLISKILLLGSLTLEYRDELMAEKSKRMPRHWFNVTKGSFEVEGTQEHKAHFMRFTGSNTWQNLIRSSIDVISGEAD